MKRDNNNITLFEFDKISVGDGDKQLSETDFKGLKRFILSNNNKLAEQKNEEVDSALACMNIFSDHGKEVIRVKNYVGIISLESGTNIEILPKIARNATKDEIPSARKLVVEMLKACGNIPYKSFQKAKLDYEKMNLYEVYIRLFLDELNELYKKGLKAGYVPHEDNENFLKGKLIFSEHIKRNFAHKEKFYVGYDIFSFDRVENRLIKSTLLYLKNKSKDDRNKRDIRRMLLVFEDITPSTNIDGDFAKCGTDRTVKHYADILSLCNVFLHKKSITMYEGTKNATALLFPMEILFQSFIAKEMKRIASDHHYRLEEHDTGRYLLFVENGEKREDKFALRPDIVLYPHNSNEQKIIIVDTKWKRLESPKDISQADMYQMYAYHTRYGKNVKKVVLFYPYYVDINFEDYKTKVFGEDILIQVRSFDLYAYVKKKLTFEKCIKQNNCIFEDKKQQ